MWKLRSQVYFNINDLLDGFEHFIIFFFLYAVRWKCTIVSTAISSVLFLIINTIYLQFCHLDLDSFCYKSSLQKNVILEPRQVYSRHLAQL